MNLKKHRLVVDSIEPGLVDYIVEEKNRDAPSTMYITGPFLMAGKKNGNNRIYPLEEMQIEVERYKKEMISTGRAMGELNHPTVPTIDLERCCHLVTELNHAGDGIYIGKSKVLNTPCGMILKQLILDGVKVGVSTRSLGEIVQESSSGPIIVKNVRLCAIDAVADPSVPSAFVNGILESKSYILDQSGNILKELEELYEGFEKKLTSLPSKSDAKKILLRNNIIEFLNALKNF